MQIKIFIFCILFLFHLFFAVNVVANDTNNYLSKPTGAYGVGFQDFHWINTNICPDPNYNRNNEDDFSSENKRFCHEVMVRIYYPTTQKKPGDPYYKPLIISIQNDLAQLSGATKKHLIQLSQLKSHSVEESPIVLGKIFPVIFFSPGYGSQVEMYENFILELVSHGYIVIGINSPFINGDIALPNGHVIKFNPDESLHELIQVTSNDFFYTYKKVLSLYKFNPIFSAMDLQHIGTLGQSLGGEIVANFSRSHSNWFQAAATLDSGIDNRDDTFKNFQIPFMREISAHRKSEQPPVPITFELGKNEFLVEISPNEQNHDFSYHMNFTDYSTLQYLPAEHVALAYYKQKKAKPLLGTGNGWEITRSINIYLLQFFNMYLKGQNNLSFKNCTPLAINTFIKCGNKSP